MRIGIIGAGNIGGNLTRRFTQLGHEVYIAVRSDQPASAPPIGNALARNTWT